MQYAPARRLPSFALPQHVDHPPAARPPAFPAIPTLLPAYIRFRSAAAAAPDVALSPSLRGCGAQLRITSGGERLLGDEDDKHSGSASEGSPASGLTWPLKYLERLRLGR
ncbi:hypothetical protein DPMN_001417 [Dreissena polymorpha]|uniref:Uncharacterized protein n=1 Tax=Dreissena polymorpha TaxID=45954 RepID=A0A9D4RSU0_DREPO|nr:hypothetical protein DPMN_001417 [Dreissena polymorpha]